MAYSQQGVVTQEKWLDLGKRSEPGGILTCPIPSRLLHLWDGLEMLAARSDCCLWTC